MNTIPEQKQKSKEEILFNKIFSEKRNNLFSKLKKYNDLLTHNPNDDITKISIYNTFFNENIF